MSAAQKANGRSRGEANLTHLAKLSAAKKGKPHSPDHRAKLSTAAKGRTLSPERIAKAAHTHASKGAAELGMSVDDYLALTEQQRYRLRKKRRAMAVAAGAGALVSSDDRC